MKRVSIQTPHLLFDVGDAAAIEERKHKGIEHRKRMRG